MVKDKIKSNFRVHGVWSFIGLNLSLLIEVCSMRNQENFETVIKIYQFSAFREKLCWKAFELYSKVIGLSPDPGNIFAK